MVVIQNRINFWDAIVQLHNRRGEGASASADSTIIILGSENAGKSTLLSSFIYKSRPSDPKPTIGLDYKYIRMNSSTENASLGKAVQHFWEIGGGRQMASALGTLITDSTAIVLVTDLSRPSSLVSDLLYWLPYIRTTATSCGRIQPQIVIVANKYDLLPAGVNLELLFRTIRSIALRYDAALLNHAVDNRLLHQQFRNAISRFLTQRPIVSGPGQFDPTKPITIAAGSDSVESIGLPPGLSSSPDQMKSWCQAYDHVFGRDPYPIPVVEPELEPEPLIDTMFG